MRKVGSFFRSHSRTYPHAYRLGEANPPDGARSNASGFNFSPKVVSLLRGRADPKDRLNSFPAFLAATSAKPVGPPRYQSTTGSHRNLGFGTATASLTPGIPPHPIHPDRELIPTEAIPLYNLGAIPITLDYASWALGGCYLLGTEGGLVNCYVAKYLDGSPEEDKAAWGSQWRPHGANSYVTKVKAIPEMDGFISSSTDETLQIFNIEKGESYVTMREDGSIRGHGSQKRDNRAVFGFDYSPELNLLVSWGENRRFIIWNPLTATCLFHRAVLSHR